MNGIYSFPVAEGQTIKKGDFLAVNTSGEVIVATPDNPNVVGIAIEMGEYIGNGQDNHCLVSLHNLQSQGPISFYAPKKPIPYENLEFEFDLKSGKPKTPVFELIFEGVARTFREVPMESREYRFLKDTDFYNYPCETNEPYIFHDNRAIANYQYTCTIVYDGIKWSYWWNPRKFERHYELLLCVIGKNTYVFQEAHLNQIRQIDSHERDFILDFSMYVDKRELILHEEVLQEKIDSRFNIELGECDRSLPSGEFDIGI